MIHHPDPVPELAFIPCHTAAGTFSHRMGYWLWGDATAAHVVLCVHGLSRQGRDFDTLCRALLQRAESQHGAGNVRIVCPDVVGRGESDWLTDPTGYQIATYASDMLALLGHLHQQAPVTQLDWVGTSMGGLIGMAVCGHPAGQAALPVPVRRLVLNDVGPVIEWQALQRIGSYLGKAGHFASVEAGADALRLVSSGFGPHTPQEWLALSRPMLRRVAQLDTTWRLHYDPALAVPFAQTTEASNQESQAMLWQLYDAISAQTLLLRGADSDLISRETALAMGQRGPRATLIEFAGVGHAPTLMAADQTRAVAGFLWSDAVFD